MRIIGAATQYLGYAQKSTICASRIRLPRDPTWIEPAGSVPPSRGSAGVPRANPGSEGGRGSSAAGLHFNDQPSAQGDGSRARGFAGGAISPSTRAVCPIFQFPISEIRTLVAGAVFLMSIV